MTSFDLDNEFHETKSCVRQVIVNQTLELIRNTPSSEDSPIIITSLPGEFWQTERMIIDGLPDDCFVAFWCFEREKGRIKSVRRNMPKNGNNYEISLNMDQDYDSDSRNFFYFANDENLNINLGDFCGISTSMIDSFIESINERNEIINGYHYINLYLNGRNGAREYLKDYKGSSMKEKQKFLINRIESKINNPNVKRVLNIAYQNKKATFLSLAYQVRKPNKFLKYENEVKEEMAKSAIMVAAGFKAAATRKRNAEKAKNRARALKAWVTIRKNNKKK